MTSKLLQIVLTLALVPVLIACEVRPPSSEPVTVPVVEPIIEPETQGLTQEYLISTEWGQEGDLGAYITFKADGTYYEGFAGEGDGGHSGRFEITEEGDLLLTAEILDERTLTLEETEETLYFTRYLALGDEVKFWDKASVVPEGSIREVDGYKVTIARPELQPTAEAEARQSPNEDGASYTFRFCGGSCEEGEEYSLLQMFDGVFAHNEAGDWYLVSINLGWYDGALIDGEQIGKISYAWVHESQLE